MGQRIDVVLLIGAVIFILEFKIGEKEYNSNAIDQVMDYALDLKNFHESSHEQFIAPILIATKANNIYSIVETTPQNDKLLLPIKSNIGLLGKIMEDVLCFSEGNEIDRTQWEQGRYCPTPTIIEAAMALYNNHSVEDIARRDASDINLTQTSNAVSAIIRSSKENSRKSVCFVTGVPGAGKTLVGLHIATTHIDKSNDLYSVFLSGNGPLVAILREALARDKVKRENQPGLLEPGDRRSVVPGVQHRQGLHPHPLRQAPGPAAHRGRGRAPANWAGCNPPNHTRHHTLVATRQYLLSGILPVH